jgi:uncharacterized protein YndB with AHSA1/START domain
MMALVCNAEEKEKAHHVLCEYEAVVSKRPRHLEFTFKAPDDYHDVQLMNLVCFKESTGLMSE